MKTTSEEMNYRKLKSLKDNVLYEWSIRKLKLPNIKEPTCYVCGMVSGFDAVVKEIETYNAEANMVVCTDGKKYNLKGRSRVNGSASSEWQKLCWMNGMDPLQRFTKVRTSIES